ncbi:hypothetical protein HBH74_137180 [Parastagonospora nodorum]|nr:hypothetical protein HBH74_137180 [Parastagonospora nodorum]KAH4970683.1 hypothetical protein HBH73_057920 [Parastagonospora nodorum]KAH6074126.1 hypothetical protein HBI67_062920 [Parastagonospora nodorum]KAH6088471.1 hypothetical protein HBI66_034440 [Parastagonospora nodorum]KAH6184053.1 hypothetical protein HBI68_013350 [Parastagonospora nodorum]
MLQLREIPLKPKPSSTPAIMTLQPSTALPTPPATPSMPAPRHPYPKAPSQELVFRNLIRGPALTLQISSEEYILPIALLCHHSTFLRKEIRQMIEMGMGPGKKRPLEEPDEVKVEKKKKRKPEPEDEGGANIEDDKKRKLESTSEKGEEGGHVNLDSNPAFDKSSGPLILSLPPTFVSPDIFSLFLSYIYKSAYSPSVDALPASYTANSSGNHLTTTTVSATLSATDFIPPSIHAYLLAHRLIGPSFMNHTLARIYAGIGVYYPLSPTLMNFVWVQTKGLALGSGVVPLRRLLLHVLIAHWPSQQFHIIVRNDPAAWTMLFEAHQDLRQEFIMGLQGGVKVQAAQGYFVGLGEMVKVEG